MNMLTSKSVLTDKEMDRALAQGDYDVVKSALLARIETAGVTKETVYQLGKVCERNKQYEEAIYWYQSIAHISTQKAADEKAIADWMPWIQLCVCYYQIGDIERSYYAHKRAGQLNPMNPYQADNESFFLTLFPVAENAQEEVAVASILQATNPRTVLLISSDTIPYERWIRTALMGTSAYSFERLDKIGSNGTLSSLCHQIYPWEQLEDLKNLPCYDVIVIAHTLTHWQDKKIVTLLKELLAHTVQSLLIIEDLLDPTLGYRRFHPTYFKQFDFSFQTLEQGSVPVQCYNLFPAPSISVRPTKEVSTPATITSSLNIGYFLPYSGLTGGMKYLLEQIKEFTKRGHKVYVYKYGYSQEEIIPSWSDLTPNDYTEAVPVPPGAPLKNYITPIDLLIVGWMDLLPHVKDLDIPVVLWEQGTKELFGDYGKLIAYDHPRRLELLARYQIADYIWSVSTLIQEIIKERYCRDSQVLTTSLDTNFYTPIQKEGSKKQILLVGNPSMPFKRFTSAIRMLNKLWETRKDFSVHWVCQYEPTHYTCDFPLTISVLPPQKDLVAAYQKADLFFATSLYESLAMTPVEAMACGTPVIVTDCGGNKTYMTHEKNGILINQEDEEAFLIYATRLLDEEVFRSELITNGRETALEFEAQKVITSGLTYIQQIVALEKQL